jgi:hypothetical protein
MRSSSVQLAFPQAQVRLDDAGFDQFSKFSVDELCNLCVDLFVGKKQINHNSIAGNRVTGAWQPPLRSLPLLRSWSVPKTPRIDLNMSRIG